MRKAFGIARLTAALVGLAALVSHLDYSLGSGASALPNFFSYFTMQSAIAATVLWPVGGVIALRRPIDPRWLVSARALVTTYQVVSGVVYTVIVTESLARGIAVHVPISSQVLHYWLPAYALLDWLFAPGRPRLRLRVLSVALVFPLIWGGFTMVRGSVVGWYPYFFLDPYQVSGPGEFLAYSVIVLAFILLMAAILAVLSAFLPPEVRREPPSPAGERTQAEPRELDDLVVVGVGERERVLRPDQAH